MLNNPYILLVLATLFWGGNFALGKAVSGSIPPMTLSYIRWMEALIFFLPFAWGAINQQKTNALENWPTFVALGVETYHSSFSWRNFDCFRCYFN